jgi:two-component system, sensor histidine kinase PdtaS
MPPVPARSTPVIVSANDGATAVRGRSTRPLRKRLRPPHGPLALVELPAGVMGVTTLEALLSPNSGANEVPLGGHLRALCDDLAARFGRSGGPQLTWAAADEALPIGTAITLELIADVLVVDALVHGFPPGRGGRIAVSFTAGQEAWQLTVNDSGMPVRTHGDPRADGLTLARRLVSRLGGRLELPRVTGGTRCIVTLPRPRA